MDTYYCVLNPGSYFYVIKEDLTNFANEQIDPLEIIKDYRQASLRNCIFIRSMNTATPIYCWNNSFWFKGRANNIQAFVKMFFDILNGEKE